MNFQDVTMAEKAFIALSIFARATAPANVSTKHLERGVTIHHITNHAFSYCVVLARRSSQLQNRTFYRLVAASNIVFSTALAVGGVSLGLFGSNDACGLAVWGLFDSIKWLARS